MGTEPRPSAQWVAAGTLTDPGLQPPCKESRRAGLQTIPYSELNRNPPQ